MLNSLNKKGALRTKFRKIFFFVGSVFFVFCLLFLIDINRTLALNCNSAHTCDNGSGICAGGNAPGAPCACTYGGTATCDLGPDVECSGPPPFTCSGADICNLSACNPPPTPTPTCTAPTSCGTYPSCYAPSGCDNQCDSTKVNGCDGVCGSGKTVDACGTCGGNVTTNTCSAPTPSCGQTTSGTWACGGSCTKTGAPAGTCDADASSACVGSTASGNNNCGTCSVAGTKPKIDATCSSPECGSFHYPDGTNTCDSVHAGETLTRHCVRYYSAPQCGGADVSCQTSYDEDGTTCNPPSTTCTGNKPSCGTGTCAGTVACNSTTLQWYCDYSSTNNSSCVSSNMCITSGATCSNGSCSGGSASGSHCSGNSCVANTSSSCLGTVCTSNANCGACTATSCNDGNSCTADTCNTATGQCSFTLISGQHLKCSGTTCTSASNTTSECTDTCTTSPNSCLSGGGGTIDPTANLTIDKPIANVGDTINYSWSSSNADVFSSTWSVSPANCGGSGNGGAWIANTSSGSWSNTIAASQVGCTYTITYNAKQSATNKTATVSKTVTVQNSVCPTTNNSVTLSPSNSVLVGQTITAQVPSGFTGGSFISGNTSFATVNNSGTVSGVSAGTTGISGSGWSYTPNGATNCSLNGASVKVQDFSITVVALPGSVVGGNSSILTVTITPLNGFNKDVTITAPSGYNFDIFTSTVPGGSGQAVFTYTPSETDSGDKNIFFTGTSN